MRTLISFLAVVGCALAACSDDKPATDAGGGSDAAGPALTCNDYCSTITTNCTGNNTQYFSMQHCLGTCAKFTPGALTDMGGQNTLGCRLYHAGNAVKQGQTPETHCPHAGPGGAAIADPLPSVCSDACTSFCTLEVAVCGTKAAPLTGIPAQYQDMAACVTSCNSFSKAKTYAIMPATSNGDSLACRLYHLTNAAVGLDANPPNTAAAVTHCPHTGPMGGPNVATCMMGTTAGP